MFCRFKRCFSITFSSYTLLRPFLRFMHCSFVLLLPRIDRTLAHNFICITIHNFCIFKLYRPESVLTRYAISYLSLLHTLYTLVLLSFHTIIWYVLVPYPVTFYLRTAKQRYEPAVGRMKEHYPLITFPTIVPAELSTWQPSHWPILSACLRYHGYRVTGVIIAVSIIDGFHRCLMFVNIRTR